MRKQIDLEEILKDKFKKGLFLAKKKKKKKLYISLYLKNVYIC